MKFEIISFLAKTTTTFFLAVLLLLPSQAAAFELFPQEEPVEKPQAAVPPPAPIISQAEINKQQAEKLQDGIKEIARQLFDHLEDQDPEVGILADGLAFTVFTDLKKLRRTSSFGRYLSEQLMTEFQQRGYRVFEVRKSQEILIQEKRGEYGLSRSADEIESPIPARALLTGTYTLAGGTVMVNAKILDNKDALMLSSATVFFAKSEMTDGLLADSASAHPKVTERMYMKKLEL